MYDICDGEITVNDGFPLFMFPLNGTDDLLVPSFRDQKRRTLEDHDGLRFEPWKRENGIKFCRGL